MTQAMTAAIQISPVTWNIRLETTLLHVVNSAKYNETTPCILFARSPNTIFSTAMTDAEQKISLRVILRKKKIPPMQMIIRKSATDMTLHRARSGDRVPSGRVMIAHRPNRWTVSWKHIQPAMTQYRGTFHHDFLIRPASFSFSLLDFTGNSKLHAGKKRPEL